MEKQITLYLIKKNDRKAICDFCGKNIPFKEEILQIHFVRNFIDTPFNYIDLLDLCKVCMGTMADNLFHLGRFKKKKVVE